MEKAKIHTSQFEETIDIGRDPALVLNELMDLYSQNVYLLAYSFVKDKGLAEDISQDVFIKCFKNLTDFRGKSSIKSWIYRITVNTSKDYLRKRKRQIFNLPKLLFGNKLHNESSEETFIRNDQNEQILHSLFSLSTNYREVLILYYFHDLNVEEIGVTLSLKINTVKTRLSRGRSLLSNILGAKKGEDLNGR